MADLRYPIGKFQPDRNITHEDRQQCIRHIAETPERLREAVEGLSSDQLDTPYRPDGWTVRQVVHHLPDSHMNAYIRFKLTLTEEAPTIKVYDEAAWAQLEEAKTASIDISLDLLESLHGRWVSSLRSLGETDFARRLDHPELGLLDLDVMLQLYAWHGPHHIAHITSLRDRKGWQ